METLSEYTFNKLAFVWRSAFDTNGKRKTVIIGERNDFCSLAATVRLTRALHGSASV
jgi:hypothetical protein